MLILPISGDLLNQYKRTQAFEPTERLADYAFDGVTLLVNTNDVQ